MSRVELYERIRRDRRVEGLSVRGLARRHGAHRRTVREALGSALPRPRKAPERESPVLGSLKPIIRGWLEDDRSKPRKQRHTARRVWERLVDEHGVVVAESTVRAYVAVVHEELRRRIADVTVPQSHEPGAEAEVDFGEFYASVAGVLLRLYLFCFRLSHSGRGFHRAFANQAQEAFFEGHVLALEHFGGVPWLQIRYDNLKPAVVRVLVGRDRLEHERFVALRSHYGFDSFFCLPGERGAHEKGGVEGEVGRFRRRHLVPVPVVGSLEELNELIAHADVRDDTRRIDGRLIMVGEHFGLERARLLPLPVERFDPVTYLRARVDEKARMCVRQSFYSVPAHLMGRKVDVRLGATRVQAVVEGRIVASHPRSLHKRSESLLLDHYLEVLAVKPGALAGATALAQARTSGAFTEAHDTYWSVVRQKLGDQQGTKALIEILLAHRLLPAESLEAALRRAVASGATQPTAVIIDARRLADAARLAPIVPIQRIGRYDRPPPTLSGYDALLKAGEAGS